MRSCLVIWTRCTRAASRMKSFRSGRARRSAGAMARPIRSIDLYLPLDDNDEERIPESKYVALQRELLSRLGGVTSVQRQFPLQGVWQSNRAVVAAEPLNGLECQGARRS